MTHPAPASRWRVRAAVLSALLCLPALAGAATQARAADALPLDRPAPAPTASAAQLKASLSCSGDLDHATTTPVLLTAATTVTSRENFSWNYIPYLRQLGVPYCTTDLPGAAGQNMEDMQRRGDYIAYAIRQMHARSGRRIAILGHSQGGMIMRWALRFWPDVRSMVDDVVGIAATNHGSVLVRALCVPNCAPALWQQRDNARFYTALNSGQETFAGISYTEIYTRTDEFVQPNLDDSGTSALHTGPGRITNVAVQDICPAAVPDHLLIGTTDPVAAALAVDALTHDGPADPARIDRAVCGRLFMPGVDPVTGPVSLAEAGARVATQLTVSARREAREPPLACYATPAGCPAVPAAPCRSARRIVLHLDRLGFRVTRATLGGRRLAITRLRGRRVVVVDLRGRAAGTVSVVLTGRTRAAGARRAVRRFRTCTARPRPR